MKPFISYNFGIKKIVMKTPHFSFSLIFTICFIIAACIVPSIGLSQAITTVSFDSGFPTNWKKYGVDSNYLSQVASGINPTQTPHSGTGEIMWNSYNISAGANAGMISPKFDLSGRGANTPTVGLWFYRDVSNS